MTPVTTAYVLMHSPLLGPSTWAPVAQRLPNAVVPSFLHLAEADEQPRLPISFFEQRIPVPAGWDDRPCAFLMF